MKISQNSWNEYISRLTKLSEEAAKKMREYVANYGLGDRQALIEYAYALVSKYGEASSELACQMYDAIVDLEIDSDLDLMCGDAEPCEMPTISDVGKAVNGCIKQSPSGQLIEGTITRLIKQTVADTMINNAIRDGAEFAWIPQGDTCAFCRILASRGWQMASEKALKGGHAEHIHAHCDCQYVIRHDSSFNVQGYDPNKYLDEYYDSDGNGWRQKMNDMRRRDYQINKEKILEQKRNAYAIRQGNKE